MSSYQQMGHQSESLPFEPDLSWYAGAILSPVNYTAVELSELTKNLRLRAGYDTIFDPQLYVPRSLQQNLRDWSYFPKDFDTADATDPQWWHLINEGLVKACDPLRPDAICSPANIPKEFTAGYFSQLVETGNHLKAALEGEYPRAIQTAIVGLRYLGTKANAMTAASVLSRTKCEEIYLVFDGDVEPRVELQDYQELKGAMRLIHELEQNASLKVIVAFASSDLLLWKEAGATHCATGKFFNVRRFTSTRFQAPPAKGGGALPYWFEESLLAFLRPADVARVRPYGLLTTTDNQYGALILEQLKTTPEEPWLALGWRQFLRWFNNVERGIANGTLSPDTMIAAAQQNWDKLKNQKPPVLMEEQTNAGLWLGPWRKAIKEYKV
jgi:hypothetical protein